MYVEMKEKQSLLLDPLLDGSARAELEDPSIYLATSLAAINRLFHQVQRQDGATVKDFYAFLETREPQLHKAIEQAWQKMDGPIQGLYLEGVLDSRTLRTWKLAVQTWRRLISAAVQLFRLHLKPLHSDEIYALPHAA